MTELSALHVRINGDSAGLSAAVNTANADLVKLGKTAQTTQGQVARSATGANTFGRAMGSASGQTANLTFQLQDIGMMLASGQSPLMLAMQQGTQVSGIFMQMGGSVKTIGPALAAAFSSLVSPLSLLTIGGIAAVAAFTQLAASFFGSSEEADALSEAAKRQKEALDELIASTEKLRLERQMLGTGAETTVEQENINRLNELLREREAIERRLDGIIVGNSRGAAYKSQLETQLAAVDAERQKLQAAIDGDNTARSQLETAKLSQGVAEKIKGFTEGTVAAMKSADGSNLVAAFQTAFPAASQLLAITRKVVGTLGGLLPATGEYDGGPDAVRTKAFGGGAFKAPVKGAGMRQAGVAGGGGGGGGGDTGLQSEIEAMQEALLTQEQLQLESFARQQGALDQALAQRLITQEQYQAMMQQAQSTHDFAMSQSVNKGVSDTLSALGSLFQGSKKIGAAVALANSWLAFTEVLKDPAYTGRPWARIAAAGQALAAGLNAVRNIKSASPGAAGGGGGGAAGIAAAPQQNVQTLNFTVQNDSFGIGQNMIRQIASQLNEAQRNGSTLIRATVS